MTEHTSEGVSVPYTLGEKRFVERDGVYVEVDDDPIGWRKQARMLRAEVQLQQALANDALAQAREERERRVAAEQRLLGYESLIERFTEHDLLYNPIAHAFATIRRNLTKEDRGARS